MIAKFLRLSAALLLFASGTAAYSQEWIDPPPGYTPPPMQNWAVFDFTTDNEPNNPNVVGNDREFYAYNDITKGFYVRITGWSLKRNCSTCAYYVQPAALMVYDGGLGIIAGDDNGGADGQHTIDNEGQKDFLLLQFNRPTELVAAVFNTYTVSGQGTDSDITVGYGQSSVAWNAPINLNNMTETALYQMFGGPGEGMYPNNVATGSSNIRYINPDHRVGDMWLIGASFSNPLEGSGSKKKVTVDGFKLSYLAVVPEPQTWAMMIAGFGLIGGAMRSRRRAVPLSA